MGDQPAEQDLLGFEPYVEAMADFLSAKATAAPLTVSIEGEWGSGKTSFMRQLEKRLSADHVTVRFNAWRHEKAEELWTAFARHLVETLARESSRRTRMWTAIRLWWARADRAALWLPAIKLVVSVVVGGWLVFIAGSELIPRTVAEATDLIFDPDGNLNVEGLVAAGGSVGVLLYLLVGATRLHEVLGNPLAPQLSKYVRSESWSEHTSFIEDFHHDLAIAIQGYAQSKRVFVFVDDLDRAALPKAADLMQALNLMIDESAPVIFILGMDRRKIAAGIGAQHANLLPYLYVADPGQLTEAARGFGYEFIEKFVQLPFRLPQPKGVDVRRMVGGGAAPHLHSESYERVVEIVSGDDPDQVADLAEMVSPLFDFNPRRIKQFVNVFRLKAHVCAATGLFDFIDSGEAVWPLSVPRLAKFVALTLRWPELAEELSEQPSLFDEIDRWVSNDDKDVKSTRLPRAYEWSTRPGVAEVFNAGVERGSLESEAVNSLKHLDVVRLLETAPPVSDRIRFDVESGEIAVSGSMNIADGLKLGDQILD